MWTYVHVMDAEKQTAVPPNQPAPTPVCTDFQETSTRKTGDGAGVHWVPWKKSSVEAQSYDDDVCENLAL